MFSSLLLFPVVGGFYFVSCLNLTRIRAKRADGYRLVFYAIAAGLVLYALSATIYPLFRILADFYPSLDSVGKWVYGYLTGAGAYSSLWIIENAPSAHQVSIGIGSVLLGVILSHFSNCIGSIWPNSPFGKNFAVSSAIDELGDPMEIFLSDALESGQQVLVTLESHKVYVGEVVRSFNPAYERLSISLLVTKSGYRLPSDHTVKFNLNYPKIDEMISEELAEQFLDKLRHYLKDQDRKNTPEVMVDKFLKGLRGERLIEENLVVVPLHRIQSIHPHDEDIYAMHRITLQADSDDPAGENLSEKKPEVTEQGGADTAPSA